MKNLFLLLTLFIANVLAAQEFATTDSGKRIELLPNGTYKYITQGSTVKESGFILEATKAYYSDDHFMIENANKILVEVKVFVTGTPASFKSVGSAKINAMLQKANTETIETVTNKSFYRPVKVSLIYMPDRNRWISRIEYLAKNSQGNAVAEKSFMTFDEKGEFTGTLKD